MLEAVRRAPPIEIALAVQKRYGRDSGGMLSAGIAYYAFFSLFPLLLLGGSVLGFVLAARPDLSVDIQDAIGDAVPGLTDISGDSLRALESSRAVTGIVALLGLLWSGTAVTEAAGLAAARVYGAKMPKSPVRKKLWSLGSTAMLGVLALISTGMTAASSAVLGRGAVGVVAGAGSVVIGLALDTLLFAIAYRVLTPGDDPKVTTLWPGAFAAALGWQILKIAGGWYGARVVADSTAVYGAFGATIGILVILSLAARIYVYGAELNAVIDERTGGDDMEAKRSETARANGQTTPQLVRSIATDAATLVRKEIELARQEMTEAVTARLKAAAALGAAGAIAFIALIVLSGAAVAALSNEIRTWAAFLIVGGGMILLAGLIAMLGIMRAKKPGIKPEQTVETVKEDLQWAKAQLRR